MMPGTQTSLVITPEMQEINPMNKREEILEMEKESLFYPHPGPQH